MIVLMCLNDIIERYQPMVIVDEVGGVTYQQREANEESKPATASHQPHTSSRAHGTCSFELRQASQKGVDTSRCFDIIIHQVNLEVIKGWELKRTLPKSDNDWDPRGCKLECEVLVICSVLVHPCRMLRVLTMLLTLLGSNFLRSVPCQGK